MSTKGSIVEASTEEPRRAADVESLTSPPPPLKWSPRGLKWWRTITLALFFIVIAAVSEGVLVRSQRYNGFPIRLKDTGLSKSQQFIKSFGPAIIFTPLFWWFDSAFSSVRLLHPYKVMSADGGALPEDSILTNYGAKGAVSALLQSLKRRHVYVGLLASITLYSGVFASLAGSYFQIVQWDITEAVTTTISGDIGVGYSDLPNPYTPFISAAGYMEAALNNGMDYSPYTLNTSDTEAWVVPSFLFTDDYDYNVYDDSAVLNVTTIAAKIIAQCVPSNGPPTITFSNTSYYNVIGRLSDDCVAESLGSDVVPAKQEGQPWFGWAVAAPQACVKEINSAASNNPPPGFETSALFAPIGISFFTNSSFASFVFCYANIERHNVTVYFDVVDQEVWNVEDLGFLEDLGQGPNGLAWATDDEANEDQLISKGISDSIAWTLGEGIVRWAGNYDHPGIINPYFQTERLEDPGSAAEVAQEAWLLYQAMIGTATLIVGNFTPSAPGTYIYASNRLTANTPVAHALAALSGTTGLALLLMFIAYYRLTPPVELAAEPAGIAHMASLVSTPGFIDSLRFKPTDPADTIQKRVSGYRFAMRSDGGGIQAVGKSDPVMGSDVVDEKKD